MTPWSPLELGLLVGQVLRAGVNDLTFERELLGDDEGGDGASVVVVMVHLDSAGGDCRWPYRAAVSRDQAVERACPWWLSRDCDRHCDDRKSFLKWALLRDR